MTLVLVPSRFFSYVCLSLSRPLFFTLSLSSAPFCVFFLLVLFSPRERAAAHLFIVLIYGNNLICRKAAGNIPRERREINFIEPGARVIEKTLLCFFRARCCSVFCRWKYRNFLIFASGENLRTWACRPFYFAYLHFALRRYWISSPADFQLDRMDLGSNFSNVIAGYQIYLFDLKKNVIKYNIICCWAENTEKKISSVKKILECTR